LEQIQFWDALIIAAASSANCSEVLTEDLNEGQIIVGVQIVSPFMQH
jgi:predicted nucleic acid-binding protein